MQLDSRGTRRVNRLGRVRTICSQALHARTSSLLSRTKMSLASCHEHFPRSALAARVRNGVCGTHERTPSVLVGQIFPPRIVGRLVKKYCLLLCYITHSQPPAIYIGCNVFCHFFALYYLLLYFAFVYRPTTILRSYYFSLEIYTKLKVYNSKNHFDVICNPPSLTDN